ncbi:hypothetical protein MLD38_037645 [Melastoma candidum]|uniref:Uncharacterized protein n=1 Tax=Melastoma candidum TaxID=119954 RepID=A0ACB9LNB0_9MYRT|nr:hypothetical protein MLD38_037645 [Melastoma candidum]
MVLENSSDGFHLANMDLLLHGPGDLLGKKQSPSATENTVPWSTAWKSITHGVTQSGSGEPTRRPTFTDKQLKEGRHASVLLGFGQPVLGIPSGRHRIGPDLCLDALDRQGCHTPNRP